MFKADPDLPNPYKVPADGWRVRDRFPNGSRTLGSPEAPRSLVRSPLLVDRHIGPTKNR
jgi:hypothetical protein